MLKDAQLARQRAGCKPSMLPLGGWAEDGHIEAHGGHLPTSPPISRMLLFKKI